MTELRVDGATLHKHQCIQRRPPDYLQFKDMVSVALEKGAKGGYVSSLSDTSALDAARHWQGTRRD